MGYSAIDLPVNGLILIKHLAEIYYLGYQCFFICLYIKHGYWVGTNDTSKVPASSASGLHLLYCKECCADHQHCDITSVSIASEIPRAPGMLCTRWCSQP